MKCLSYLSDGISLDHRKLRRDFFSWAYPSSANFKETRRFCGSFLWRDKSVKTFSISVNARLARKRR